jgi:hypothetical protein
MILLLASGPLFASKVRASSWAGLQQQLQPKESLIDGAPPSEEKRNPRSNSRLFINQTGLHFIIREEEEDRVAMHPNTAYFLRSPDWNVTRHLLPTTTTSLYSIHSLTKRKPPKQQQGKRKKTRPAQGLEWVKTKGMKNFQKNLQNGRSRPPKWKQKKKKSRHGAPNAARYLYVA